MGGKPKEPSPVADHFTHGVDSEPDSTDPHGLAERVDHENGGCTECTGPKKVHTRSLSPCRQAPARGGGESHRVEEGEAVPHEGSRGWVGEQAGRQSGGVSLDDEDDDESFCCESRRS